MQTCIAFCNLVLPVPSAHRSSVVRLQVGTHLGSFCCWKALFLLICPNPGKDLGLRVGSLDLVQCPQELALVREWSLTLPGGAPVIYRRPGMVAGGFSQFWIEPVLFKAPSPAPFVHPFSSWGPWHAFFLSTRILRHAQLRVNVFENKLKMGIVFFFLIIKVINAKSRE